MSEVHAIPSSSSTLEASEVIDVDSSPMMRRLGGNTESRGQSEVVVLSDDESDDDIVMDVPEDSKESNESSTLNVLPRERVNESRVRRSETRRNEDFMEPGEARMHTRHRRISDRQRGRSLDRALRIPSRWGFNRRERGNEPGESQDEIEVVGEMRADAVRSTTSAPESPEVVFLRESRVQTRPGGHSMSGAGPSSHPMFWSRPNTSEMPPRSPPSDIEFVSQTVAPADIAITSQIHADREFAQRLYEEEIAMALPGWVRPDERTGQPSNLSVFLGNLRTRGYRSRTSANVISGVRSRLRERLQANHVGTMGVQDDVEPESTAEGTMNPLRRLRDMENIRQALMTRLYPPDIQLPLTYESLLELDDRVEPTKGASEAKIRRLQLVNATAEHAMDRCSICLSNIEQGELLKQLPCAHVFHPDCIDPWLKRNSCCPIDKGRI